MGTDFLRDCSLSREGCAGKAVVFGSVLCGRGVLWVDVVLEGLKSVSEGPEHDGDLKVHSK